MPAIWALEVANALLVSERRHRLTEADTAKFLDLLHKLPFIVDPETCERGTGETLSLAREHGLSSYDAAYLELAMREGLPLATADELLRKAARNGGAKLFEGG